ncbi:MAG: permease-like cell division protein FtsX [Pseudomonadota bacterium]
MTILERPWYFLRNGAANLIHAPVLTVITVLTVGISLVLVGFLAFLLVEADRLLEETTGGFQMTVYLEPDLSVQEGEELAAVVLEQWPEVSRAVVFSGSQDFERNKALLPPEILQGLEEDLIPAQPYMEVTTDIRKLHGEKLDQMVGWFRSLEQVEGVDEILMGSEKLRVAFTLLESFRFVAGVIAIVVVLAALFFVLATIRLSAHARRDEIDVMLLVGATKTFVRIPFYIEGMLAGLFGGALAYAVVWALETRITAQLRAEGLLGVSIDLIPSGMGLALLGGGVALGLLGAVLGLGRYLRLSR